MYIAIYVCIGHIYLHLHAYIFIHKYMCIIEIHSSVTFQDRL